MKELAKTSDHKISAIKAVFSGSFFFPADFIHHARAAKGQSFLGRTRSDKPSSNDHLSSSCFSSSSPSGFFGENFSMLARNYQRKTGVINDPLGQTHSLASSEQCFSFVLFC